MEKNAESKDIPHRASQEAAFPEHLRQSSHVAPDVDILEKPDELLLRVDIPGVDADSVEARAENQTLIISGKARRRPPEDATFLVREYEPRDYYREFLVGDWVDPSKISADYSDGVLTIHLPKAETMKPRKIEVQKK